ncbi:MAG: hypothetical protein ABSG04_09840 [Verrucomicrobiota bacterium]
MIRNSPLLWDYLLEADKIIQSPNGSPLATPTWYVDLLHPSTNSHYLYAQNIQQVLMRGRHNQNTKPEGHENWQNLNIPGFVNSSAYNLNLYTVISGDTANGNYFFGGAGNGGTGVYNLATGLYSLVSLSYSIYNTAYGETALAFLTLGNSNTAVGFAAGNSLTSGSSNIFVGMAAGCNIVTGNGNIDIGNPGMLADTLITRIGNGQTDAYISGTIHGNGSGLIGILPIGLSGTIATSNLPPALSNLINQVSTPLNLASATNLPLATAVNGTIATSNLPPALSNLINQVSTPINAVAGTNYQATNLVYQATQSAGISITSVTNATIDASFDDIYYSQTANLNFSNIINVNCLTNQTRRGIVHIKPNGNYTIGFNYSANCTLIGAYTTNWLPVGASNGFYTLAWEIMFTNFNSNTCTYAIVPPNK